VFGRLGAGSWELGDGRYGSYGRYRTYVEKGKRQGTAADRSSPKASE